MTTIKRQPIFGFANWINEGFWMLYTNKFLAVPVTLMILLSFLLPISGGVILSKSNEDISMLIIGGTFLSLGLILLPIFVAGLWTFTENTDKTTNYLFSLLFSGFKKNLKKLISLGLGFLLSNIVFLMIGAALSALTIAIATSKGMDIESEMFQTRIMLPNLIYLILIYPFVIAQIIYSPFLITKNSEISVFSAIKLSIKAVTQYFFSFTLLLIYTLLLFVIFLVMLGFLPGVISGLISILPWENQMAVTKAVMILPQTVIFFGALFCLAWVFTIIYKSYGFLFEDS